MEKNSSSSNKLERAFEIILIIIGVCAVIFCFAYFTDVFKSFLPNNNLTITPLDGENPSITDALTLEVNAINNILTWGSFIVAALTIAAAVFGILGVSAFREETRNSTKSAKRDIENIKTGLTKAFKKFVIEQNTRLDNYNCIINNYSNKVDKVECFTNQIERIQKSLIQQGRYIDNTAEYLYQVTYSNISQMANQDEAQQLLDHLYHELQIATLYRVTLDADEARIADFNKRTALEYLEGNGSMEDIPHLDYIAQHDPDEHVRTRAIEVRAIIRNRYDNQGGTTPPVVS